jgi:hypothetical protein
VVVLLISARPYWAAAFVSQNSNLSLVDSSFTNPKHYVKQTT